MAKGPLPLERRSVEAVIGALNAAGVRHLIVGGLAVVAHGHGRLTVDIDLVLDPDPEARRKAVGALERLGYRPRVPVPFVQFADPERRSEWARDKGMMVFTAISPEHALTDVDLFLESPFDFEAAHAGAMRETTASGVVLTIVAKTDLIEMKRRAGRPQDLLDIDALESMDEGGGANG